ncbi:MAG TPA: cupin domain-containing protein [Oscillospiraceae bacterium]|nr:cupin domain-containing protein [Oscillospiraceae bacterium]
MNVENGIPGRIRELREVCGYSVKEFAEAFGIDAEKYAGYEKDGADIPISVIFQIANKCGVDFNEIVTGTSAKLDTYHIVKRGEGKPVSRYPGYFYEDLAYRYSKKVMQPLLVTLNPSDEPAALVCHSGQEFNMVLEGQVAIVFDDKEFILSPGDTIYFNPTHLHGQRCVGDKKARFLTVIAD